MQAFHPLRLYSPFHSKGHVPTSHPHTEFVPVESVLNSSYTFTAGYEYIWLMSWTPTGYLLTTFYSKADQSIDPVGGNVFAGVQLGATAAAQPLNMKPLRLGMQMSNITPSLTRGGVCYATPVTSPLPIAFGADNPGNNWINITLATFNQLKLLITANRHVQTIPSREIDKRSFICVPNNEVDYERFYDFVEETIPDNDDNLNWQNAYTAIQSSTPMNSWLFYFPSTSSDQNWIYTVKRTDGCKYAITSPLQSTATRPPSLTAESHRALTRAAGQLVLNHDSSKHETWTSRVVHAGEDALGNIGSGLVRGAEWFGRNALARGGAALARGLGWMASEAPVAAEALPLLA